MGTVRDFSIDYRDNRYFKFDPHITPGLDGVSVFMVTLESDGVITLIPPQKEIYRRSNMDEISKYSYTDNDLDILHKRGDLLCLSDKAREKLDWSNRLGIDAKTSDIKRIVARKHFVTTQIQQQNIDDKQEDDNNENNNAYYEPLNEDDELYGATVVGNEDIIRDLQPDQDAYVLCDWWGTSRYLIPRNKEKILITITFSRPT